MTAYPGQPQPQPQQPFYGPEAQNIKVQEYLHTPLAGALVPLIQSGITATLAGVLVLIVLVWQGVADWPVYSLIVWLVIWVLAWWDGQKHWWSLTTVERMTGVDINGDGVIGSQDDQDKPAHVVRVDLRTTDEAGGYQAQRTEFPVTESQMSTVARLMLAGRLSERDLAGCGVGVNTLRDLKRVLRAKRILEYINPGAPNQGDKLTRVGVAVMQHFAGLSSPLPSPTDESE